MKRFLWATSVALCLSGAVHAASTAVIVDVEPPVITRRTFDPKHPPADMPRLTPPEIGTCVYSFGCTTELQIRGPENRPARVTEVRVRPRLVITLWTPQEGPPKILAHEEAHRAICEHYYAPAESLARELAQRELGRTLKSAANQKTAVEAELRVIQDALIADFLRETAKRCDFAQARFDVITQHSISVIPEEEAMATALAEEKAAYAANRSETQRDQTAGAGAGVPDRSPPTRPGNR